MNELAKTNGNLPATPSSNPYLEFAEEVGQSRIVGKLLKFAKGDWMAGQDSEMIEDGTKFVANMENCLRGWIRWWDNKPTDHVMGLVSKGYKPPRRDELGDHDQELWAVDDEGKSRDPWQESYYLLMQGTGTDDGELYTFTTNSVGGRGAIAKLNKAFGDQWRQRPNQYPVVEIGQDSYPHKDKSRGRIKFPTFKIVGWVPKSAFVSPDAQAVAADDEPAELNAPERQKDPAAPPPASKPSGKPKGKARF